MTDKLPPFHEYVRNSLSQSDSEKFDLLLQARFNIDEKYPVDFDLLWKQLEFTRKSHEKALQKNY